MSAPSSFCRNILERGTLSFSTAGGFYHDGRFATLLDVVNHYDGLLKLNLGDAQKKDLVEYLKGI